MEFGDRWSHHRACWVSAQIAKIRDFAKVQNSKSLILAAIAYFAKQKFLRQKCAMKLTRLQGFVHMTHSGCVEANIDATPLFLLVFERLKIVIFGLSQKINHWSK